MAHILAVDDSRSVIKMVEFALKSRGHSVVTAEDGDAALMALQQTAFDLLVLDINMPCLDGLAVLQIIRAKAEWQALPILMLTTEGQEVDRDKALALGATAYMTKPFKPSDLLDRIARMLI